MNDALKVGVNQLLLDCTVSINNAIRSEGKPGCTITILQSQVNVKMGSGTRRNIQLIYIILYGGTTLDCMHSNLCTV